MLDTLSGINLSAKSYYWYMVINKKASKIYKFVEPVYIEVLFVGTVVLLYDLGTTSIISSHVMTELTTVRPKYLPFS